MALPGLGGFLGELDKISVFDGNTYNKAIDENNKGQHQVILTPEKPRTISQDIDYAVKGVLKGGINFSTQANWGSLEIDSAIGGLVANTGILKAIKNATNITSTLGGAKLETELESKKFYTGGSYITLPVEMRVLDDDNSGKTLKSAILLMAMTTPRETNSVKLNTAIDSMISLLPKNAEKTLKALADVVGSGTSIIKQGLKQGETNKSDLTSNVAKTLNRGLEEIGESDVRLTESPTSVTIQIGKWLTMKNMVVENVSVAFSPQMTEFGPMFADFTLQISSRYKVVLGETGFKRVAFGSGAGRVKIINSNTQRTASFT